mgnify:CR=1 FL=1
MTSVQFVLAWLAKQAEAADWKLRDLSILRPKTIVIGSFALGFLTGSGLLALWG